MKWMLISIISLASMTSALSAKSPVAPEKSPKEVSEQFYRMERAGARLTPEGWHRAAGLFLRPGAPTQDKKIFIVKNDVMSDTKVEGNRAEFYVQYLQLGQLDSSGRFLKESKEPLEAGPISVRVLYNLVLTDRHWELGAERGEAKEVKGSPEWLIEGFQPWLWITVDTALRYLTELRDKASDRGIKENADRSIAALKRLR